MKDLSVLQIFYRADQKASLEPDFIAYDNTRNPRPELCEWLVIDEVMSEESKLDPNGWFGIVSWKFRDKTKLSSSEFTNFVRSAPPADVYFVSPFTDDRVLWPSPWAQGEERHPGLLAIADEAFQALGYDRTLLTDWYPAENVAFCNYFVATAEFWRAYYRFVAPVSQWMRESAPEATRKHIWINANPLRHQGPFPFVMERLFSTFLENERRRGRSWRVHSHPVDLPWLSRTYGKFADAVLEAYRFREILDRTQPAAREELLASMRTSYFAQRTQFSELCRLRRKPRSLLALWNAAMGRLTAEK